MGYSKTNEPMLFTHSLYLLALHGPIEKEKFFDQLFQYLNENKLVYSEDIKLTKSRKGRTRREKIAQIIRNLIKSHGTLTDSVLIEETSTHYRLKSGVLKTIQKLIEGINPIDPINHLSSNSNSLQKLLDKTLFSDGPIKTYNLEPLCVLLEGAPGTGKSMTMHATALEIVKGRKIDIEKIEKINHSFIHDHSDNKNIFSVQFHPSYSYEDFVEGLRPVENLENSASIRYQVIAGPLKVAIQLANAYWTAYTKKKSELPSKIEFSGFVDNKNQLIIPAEYSSYGIDKRDGIIFINDSSEKYYAVAKTKEGVRSHSKIEITGVRGLKSKYHTFYWVPTTATSKKIPQFVVCIDELNRGVPSKIFGELLTQIEPHKRSQIGKNKPKGLILPGSKNPLFLTPNLHLLCARNLADRNLAILDLAFLRRFNRIEFKPHWGLFKSNAQIKKHFENINMALSKPELDISSKFRVGQYYGFEVENRISKFRKNKKALPRAIAEVWDLNLAGQLEEILRTKERESLFVEALLEIEKQNESLPPQIMNEILNNAFVEKTNKAAS